MHNKAGGDTAQDASLQDAARWQPSALTAWWARLPDWARALLKRRINPHNQTRVHLAAVIARRKGQIVIGPYTYGRPKLRFPESGARLTIGRYGSIADGVEILLGGNHRLDWITTYPFPALSTLWPEAAAISGSDVSRGDVTIGHDVWLGSQCLILSGVAIGHGAAVAARAVVTRDVPPYAIVAGNPARVIRYRFPPEQIAALLALGWWNWPESEVRAAIPLLLSDAIDAVTSGPASQEP